MSKQVQVVRVIIMEGDEDWIDQVLDSSWLKPQVEIKIGLGKFIEVARVQQEIPE